PMSIGTRFPKVVGNGVADRSDRRTPQSLLERSYFTAIYGESRERAPASWSAVALWAKLSGSVLRSGCIDSSEPRRYLSCYVLLRHETRRPGTSHCRRRNGAHQERKPMKDRSRVMSAG